MAWKWTSERERAAELVADDGLSDRQIAQELGINRKTLERWRKIAEFRARVKAITEAAQKKALEYAIADKHRRLGVLNEMWLGLQQIIDARAIDPAMQRAPGGNTGLLVRKLKSIRVPKGYQHGALVDRNTLTRGSKTTFGVIEEFKLDAALLRTARRLGEQAAREMGQWGKSAGAQRHGPAEQTIRKAPAVKSRSTPVTLGPEALELAENSKVSPAFG